MGILYFSGMKPLDLKSYNRSVWLYLFVAVLLVIIVIVANYQLQPKSALDFTLYYLLLISIAYLLNQFRYSQQDMLWGEAYALPEKSNLWWGLIAACFTIWQTYYFLKHDFEFAKMMLLTYLVPVLIFSGIHKLFKDRSLGKMDLLWQENRLYVESSLGHWEEIELPCTFKFHPSSLEIRDATNKQVLLSCVPPRGDKFSELLNFVESKPITLLSSENHD